jgi:hypothetical protein
MILLYHSQAYLQRNVSMHKVNMLTAVLFTSAALWNQTRYSSIDELMN